ncbi:MAG: hypothetical protein HY260_18780, partial [Chloroflexi bacterium]|nr:hypothetical protein [Chloroflexota bacterium]
ETDAPEEYEDAILAAFAQAVDPAAVATLHDPTVVVPFANMFTCPLTLSDPVYGDFAFLFFVRRDISARVLEIHAARFTSRDDEDGLSSFDGE